MKRKLLALLLAVSCVLSVTACGGKEASAEVSEETEKDSKEAEREAKRAEREAAREAKKNGEEDKDSEAKEKEAEEKEAEAKEAEEKAAKEKEEAEKKEAEAKAAEEKAAEEAKADAKDKPATEMPSTLSDDLYDFQVSINGTVYQFPMWYSDFEALGWEYDGDNTQTLSSNQYTLSDRWKKDGVSVYTKLANLSMNSVALTDSMVASIDLDKYDIEDSGWEIVMPGGITWGVSGTDDIKAAYGDPTSDYDGDNYYKMTYEYDIYNEVSFYVYKESGVLESIEIENIVELEGADNSVDSTVPDMVKNYKAPSALGDDYYSYNVELEGELYTLPCPVSVFIENGFEINESDTDMEVAAGSFGWVTLRYNNQELRGIARNYADYATVIENCFVTTVEASDYGPNFDLNLPGGITLGATEDEVKAAIDGFNFETETSDSGFTYYTIYDPNGSKLDAYNITLKDNAVMSIEVENSEKPEY